MAANANSTITRKKVIGLLGLIAFSLIFIFSCMRNVLPIGKTLVGTFGIMVYPCSIIFAFLSLAKFLGFSYSRNVKSTAYFCIALISVLLAIHSISTFKYLDKVVNFSMLKNYLNVSYNVKTTLFGSFGSVLCGILSIMLGAMGTVIVFVILATLFGGILLDFQLYGKYEAKHIKKLKKRSLREKVNNSDKNITKDGKPNYSFESSNSEVVDEITVDVNEYAHAANVNNVQNINTTINSSDVVDEITDETISETYDDNYATNVSVSDYKPNEMAMPSYNVNDISSFTSSEPQTQNEFTDNFYNPPTYPDVYSSETNDYRRQFMHDTFGISSAMQQESDSVVNSDENLNLDLTTNLDINNFSTKSSDFQESSNTENMFSTNEKSFAPSNMDDELAKIFSTSEDDLELEVKSDISANFNQPTQSFEPIKTNSNFSSVLDNSNEIKQNNTFEPVKTSNPILEEQKPASFASSFNAEPIKASFNTQPIRQPIDVPKIQSNFNNINPQKSEVVIPAKEVPQNKYNLNISMPGVRYNPPPLSLLRTPKPDTGDYTEEQNRKSAKLESVLAAFNIPAKVKNIVRGPKITRYELSVPLGISVKKIPMCEEDIAAALAAKTIVIKAPIPGSSYVGIELENDTFTTVYQRELLESEAFQNCKDPLPLAIGKDISGEIVVKSLAKMVHLLIAGSTGSGKSVFIHNIVLSLIYKNGPEDMRLIMIDPKRVEFNRYNGLPHLLTPEVVMGADKAINALKWAVKEMDRRYDLMSKSGYNNIESYNKSDLVKAGQFDRFPYIVIIVDELAEIMQVNKKEVEACIQRLTQLARACGMHMILATQRPSVDIISGVIKNNVPSRIAFSLQSGIDSKTILNSVGAEKLLGQGDMIFAPTGTSATPRLQASYASDDEIRAVIEYDKKYNPSNYDDAVNSAINAEQMAEESAGFSGGDGVPPQRDTVDNYFKTAVKLVMMNGGASTSYLQRRLSIGYSRAARIMDQMEDKGYIAPTTGSKIRKVLITPDQFREEFNEEYDDIND